MCTLKDLTAHAVERVGGPIAAAKLLDVSTTEISWWCNPNHTRYIPFDHLVDLDSHAGDLILKALADKRGYDVTSRADKPAPETNIFHIIANFSKAAGVFACTVLEAAIDGVFSPNEKRKIAHSLRPVKDALGHVDDVALR